MLVVDKFILETGFIVKCAMLLVMLNAQCHQTHQVLALLACFLHHSLFTLFICIWD